MKNPTLKDRILGYYWLQKNKLLHKLLKDFGWDFGEYYMEELELAYRNFLNHLNN